MSTGAEKMRGAQPAKKGGAWETAGQEKRVAAALRARGNPRFERIGKVRRVENHPRESDAAKSCREPPRGGFVGRMPKGGEMRFGNANLLFAVREITCPRRITPARRRPDDGRTARPLPTGPTRSHENISYLLGPVRVPLHDDSGARSAPCRATKTKDRETQTRCGTATSGRVPGFIQGLKTRDGGVSDTHTCFATRCVPSNFIIGETGVCRSEIFAFTSNTLR